MKKFLFALAAMALLVSCSSSSDDNNDPVDPVDPVQPADTILCTNNAMTIVSYDETGLVVTNEPTNRNAVIEEYTGVSCGYCPDGHRIVNEAIAEYPGHVFGVNIHAGYYSNDTYTTKEGTQYDKEADVDGYPAGSVNRHLFSGTSTALNRGTFKKAVERILAMASPVNLAATAEVDQATRTLTVKVKGYYTTAQKVETNSLYVFILQDSVMGNQSDYGSPSFNSDQWVNGKYRHMHMFRTCITGTWGQTITPEVGANFNRTYTYVIPEKLGDERPIEAVLKDLKVLVFVAEGHQEILQVIEPELIRK